LNSVAASYCLTLDGRAAAVAGVRVAGGGRLDGLVACAGLGPHVEPCAAIVAVNFFGAQALLAGLRDALAAGGRQFRPDE